MLAGEERDLDAGHGADLARPETGAEGDRIAPDRAPRRLHAADPAALGQDAGHAGLLEEPRAEAAGRLHQRGADIGGAHPAVIG